MIKRKSKKDEEALKKKYPFIGMFKWGKYASDNDKIDEALCGEIEGKL